MDSLIILTIWRVQALTAGDWMLAFCFALLALLLYQLVIRPMAERVHRDTWL